MDRQSDAQLAERLLAEDHRGQGPVLERRGDGYALLQAMLDAEQAVERRVRQWAVLSWRTLVALIPLTGVLFWIMRVGGGSVREVVRAALLVTGTFTLLAIFVAVLTTVAWLFRSRSASLAIIERRLAALEDLLTRTR